MEVDITIEHLPLEQDSMETTLVSVFGTVWVETIFDGVVI